MLAGSITSTSRSITSGSGRRADPCSVARPSSRAILIKTVTAQAQKGGGGVQQKEARSSIKSESASPFELGPIGMTISSQSDDDKKKQSKAQAASPLELGPIGMTIGGDASTAEQLDKDALQQRPVSISKMTTAEWRAKYEKDGTVDLWVEEEFNAGSRLIGGRAVHYGDQYGVGTGEGKSAGNVVTHKVKIHNHYADQELEVEVPEDRYILWEAEDHGLQLPYACRMGCCTACAVRIKSGKMYQPEALGISEELKQRGYGLMCVGYPLSDVELETVSEDEVYDLQFGLSFEQQALDPNNNSIERDDFAIEIANMDE